MKVKSSNKHVLAVTAFFMGVFLVVLFAVCYAHPLPFRTVAFVVQTSTGYRVNDVPFYLYLADDVPKGVSGPPDHIADATVASGVELSSVELSVPLSTTSHRPTMYNKDGRYYMHLDEGVVKACLGDHGHRLLRSSQVDLRQFVLDVTRLAKHNLARSWLDKLLVTLFLAPEERRELHTMQSRMIPGSHGAEEGSESRAFLVIHPRTVQATVRYAAKSHMVCPPQIIMEYPLAFIAVVQLGLGQFPHVITPTLVSLVHLCCGLAAGVCFAKSVKVAAPYRRATNPELGEGDALVNLTPMSPTGMTDWEGSRSQLDMPPEVPQRASVDRRWVLLGCALFWLRNYLDLVDGVLARYHRLHQADPAIHRKGAGVSFGLNGHTVDVVTDTIGCTLACVGLLVAMCRLKYTLPAWWFACFHRLPLPAFVFRKVLHLGRLRFSQGVVFCGLAIPAAAAAVWEIYMLRYNNLLDPTAMYDAGLFELEGSLSVRICWFLWSLSAGDTWVACFVLCAVVGYRLLWNFSIFAASVGYIWVVLLGLWSEWVWQTVVLTDLSAAAIGA